MEKDWLHMYIFDTHNNHHRSSPFHAFWSKGQVSRCSSLSLRRSDNVIGILGLSLGRLLVGIFSALQEAALQVLTKAIWSNVSNTGVMSSWFREADASCIGIPECLNYKLSGAVIPAIHLSKKKTHLYRFYAWSYPFWHYPRLDTYVKHGILSENFQGESIRTVFGLS